jgi:hypothetical protein
VARQADVLDGPVQALLRSQGAPSNDFCGASGFALADKVAAGVLCQRGFCSCVANGNPRG